MIFRQFDFWLGTSAHQALIAIQVLDGFPLCEGMAPNIGKQRAPLPLVRAPVCTDRFKVPLTITIRPITILSRVKFAVAATLSPSHLAIFQWLFHTHSLARSDLSSGDAFLAFTR
jgi:hypothetical protein